jgi:hypothetical protein
VSSVQQQHGLHLRHSIMVCASSTIALARPLAALTASPGAPAQVCHVDSGVRVDHPDLAPNVLKGWNFVPAGQVQQRGGRRA